MWLVMHPPSVWRTFESAVGGQADRARVAWGVGGGGVAQCSFVGESGMFVPLLALAAFCPAGGGGLRSGSVKSSC